MPPRREGRDSSALVLSLSGGLSVRMGMRCDRMESSRGLSSSPMSGVVRLIGTVKPE